MPSRLTSETLTLVVVAPAGTTAVGIVGRLATLGFGVRLVAAESVRELTLPEANAVVVAADGDVGSSLATVEELNRVWPGLPVVLVGPTPDVRTIRAHLRAGAREFCFDDDSDDEVRRTLTQVAAATIRAPAPATFPTVPAPPASEDDPTQRIGADARAALTALAGKRAETLLQRHGLGPPSPRTTNAATYAAVPVSIKDLPIVDSRISELQALMEREVVELRAVESFVTGDPSLVVAIIKASNSAYYRSPKLVTNLRDACVRLGNRQVFALLMETLLQRSFQTASPEAARTLGGLWKNATLTARLSRKLAEWVGLGRPEDVYVAGLLHNLGELVLVWRVCETSGGTLAERLEAEADRIQTGHESTGRYVSERWGLPPLVQQLNAHHHLPRPGAKAPEERLRLGVLGAWAVSRQLLGDTLPNQPPVDPMQLFDQLELADTWRTRLADECASALTGL